MAKDYYQILGVKKNADTKEIKAAYRKLARKLHPDVNPGDEQAEARFKEINRAHEVLSDPEKRAKYDRYGEKWEQAEAFEKARAQAGMGGNAQTFHFNMSDLGDLFRGRGGGGGTGGFEDILGNLFGGAGRRSGQMRGQNTEYATEITLEEAYAGTTRTLQMQGQEPCPTCGGSGEIANAVCHTCQGAGAVVKPSRIEVKIPAGAKDGTRVRLAGKGSAGMGGGPRGDLYVVVKVRPHARFTRKGDDLVTEIEVPVEDAVLGGEAEVETIAGKHIAVKVPPMTQNGKSIRLGGLGMPKLNSKEKGDLLAKVRIVIPEELSDSQRELFEQLRAEREKRPAGAKA
jgi:molecular chaperone DnaJ